MKMNIGTYLTLIAFVYFVTSIVLGFVLGAFCIAGFEALFGAGLLATLCALFTSLWAIWFSDTWNAICGLPGKIISRFVQINPAVMPAFN